MFLIIFYNADAQLRWGLVQDTLYRWLLCCRVSGTGILPAGFSDADFPANTISLEHITAWCRNASHICYGRPVSWQRFPQTYRWCILWDKIPKQRILRRLSVQLFLSPYFFSFLPFPLPGFNWFFFAVFDASFCLMNPEDRWWLFDVLNSIPNSFQPIRTLLHWYLQFVARWCQTSDLIHFIDIDFREDDLFQ